MTYGQMGRRTVLAGGASLMGLLLAGCATSSSPSQVTAAAVAAPVDATGPVPQDVALMYAAVADDRYPIRASRMELVPEQFWRQEVSNPTGEGPGTVVVDTQNRFLLPCAG